MVVGRWCFTKGPLRARRRKRENRVAERIEPMRGRGYYTYERRVVSADPPVGCRACGLDSTSRVA